MVYQISEIFEQTIKRDLSSSIQTRIMSYGYWGNCVSQRRSPIFPAGRIDVAVCHNTYECASKGSGVEILILVIEGEGGHCGASILYESTPEENVHVAVDEVKVNGKYLEVTFSSGGPVGGQPWKKTEKRRISE